jgi:hypothetical protein
MQLHSEVTPGERLRPSGAPLKIHTSRTPEEGAHSPKLAKRASYHHHL